MASSKGSSVPVQNSSGHVLQHTSGFEGSRPSSSSALLPGDDLAAPDAVQHGGSGSIDDDLMAPTRRKSGSLIQNGHTRAKSAHVEGDDIEPGINRRGTEMDDIESEDETLADDEETGLTEPERKQRTIRKSKSARLDAQVNSGAASIRSGISEASMGTTEEKLVKPTLIKNMVLNAVLIGLWYSFSISISVYNKWMFSGDNLDFQFPLFTTSLHMIVQFSLANLVLYFMPQFRPWNSNATISDPHGASYSRLNQDETDDITTPEVSTTKKSSQPLMTKWFYLTRIGPCGTATAMDIGLGNFSLRFISLTFFTMCKSSVLGFVLLFAFIFHLEQPTWKLCLIILIMTTGVVMMVAGEAAFNALGFILIMLASLCSGFRWSLTQILLLRNRATSNPFSSIFFLTPVMFLALFILALPIEGPANVIEGVKKLAASEGGFRSFGLLLFPGILAFLMVSAEFALLKRTSVVTLSVCGIFKEVLTISTASTVFGDELSPINVSGLFVTILSIAAYNYIKITKMRKEAAEEAHAIVVTGDINAGGPDPMGRNKGAVVAGPDASVERRDSSSALISDGQLDGQMNDRGHDGYANGGIGNTGKKPEHLD